MLKNFSELKLLKAAVLLVQLTSLNLCFFEGISVKNVFLCVFLFVVSMVLPFFCYKKVPSFRLKMCAYGKTMLEIFTLSSTLTFLYQVVWLFAVKKQALNIPALIIFIIGETVFFWTGMITVYIFSEQLGLKKRFMGIICGMLPVVNLFCLADIMKTCSSEVKLESEKHWLNESRKNEKICKTKYPILLVHGVFFRDWNHFNYWGRVPAELIKNGASVFYGGQESAASVEKCAAQVAEAIDNVLEKTGAQKVNIIAHSKGGLDSRYAIAKFGMADKVASLTTINTPHRGCFFADYLLKKIDKAVKNTISNSYNMAARALGDKNPDFMEAVTDLTADACKKRNELLSKDGECLENIYCQSVGSEMAKAKSGRFPLNLSYDFVKHFDGRNDGLVGEDSFRWGEDYTFLTNTKKRGISHADMIDLNRENIEGFDVREFYVKLVSELKNKGM